LWPTRRRNSGLVRLITLATRLALRISALVAVLITLVTSVSVLIRKLTP